LREGSGKMLVDGQRMMHIAMLATTFAPKGNF